MKGKRTKPEPVEPAPVQHEEAKPKRVPPTFEPFEKNRQSDGSYISTWRHEDGSLEQWHGDEMVYGPEAQ